MANRQSILGLNGKAPEAAPQKALPAAPQKRSRRGFFRRWSVRLVLAALALLIGYQAWLFWQVWRLREHNPATTAFMQQGLERLREQNPHARLRQTWVPYDRISVHLKRAVLAAEDQKFLQHDGFDWEEMEKAYEKNQLRQRVVRGASTISQQLAKNLFLSGQRNYLRKGQEAVITVMIEHSLSKRRVLEIYLNVIEWGNGIYGAEAAARHYYGKGAWELDEGESARLAAVIPNPRFYHRRGFTPYLEQRALELLTQMNDMAVP